MHLLGPEHAEDILWLQIAPALQKGIAACDKSDCIRVRRCKTRRAKRSSSGCGSRSSMRVAR